MTPPVDVYVGLGSNLDDPVAQVRRALDELGTLPLSERIATSRLYASRPVGPQDQPNFINAVAHLRTRLSPLALLDQLQALEQRHHRIRQRHWGPRTLDLDLLLYGNETLKLVRLQVPHREMTSRAFVLLPLAELAPRLQLPDGRHIAELTGTLATAGEVEVLPDDAN
ncbi:2-amino-4-hydroxy-6-hydroxymethyldihydropteridine diphosphokinase [Billgrantia diversa]|uniref:2-amino-4-hydroxy-6- hydroxymethyldihydropteridine diphosphokinase n=1 Tax=Halomonas sp. MCCC 1A13316 TaxID=2733487 RepID=UPI0018A3B329|nr:2-amino-4-hydroxy-6-hydroxymethyldihydropteridine diphosphokinase [Halomonas sp. MCCC 1A13316]QOR40470.1 2-amino-4-hydroxy-6-hydroxymethyldihydropteridine diphosphokinase [Halomonas sp. MCCC 1A13316]